MKKVQGNDSFQRMNYLYQISKYVSGKNPALSSYYGNLIVNVAKKNVLRLHPEIKRQMCKKCKCMLINNVTCKMRIKTMNKSKVFEWTCNICDTKKKLPVDKNKDHKLWVDKREAVVEKIVSEIMRLVLYLISISISVSIIHSSIYTNVKDNVLSILKRSFGEAKQDAKQIDYEKSKPKEIAVSKSKPAWPNHDKVAKFKKKIIQPQMKYIPSKKGPLFDKGEYEKDLVLNLMSRRAKIKDFSSMSSESSSLEIDDWKDSWNAFWTEKKLEAINTSQPRGDTVNMIGARPWGVPCGDPDQHDMPWGACMLPMECEAEFRIYRGDIFCGRTQFICCGLQINSYDMYQGFDNSFEDSMLATSSEEKKQRDRGSKENKRRKRIRDKKRRRRQRRRRKRKIKRTIRKIVREIRRILNRLYRNGTSNRKKKTKQLKKFVKNLKKQYKKDRNVVKKIHGETLQDIDAGVQNKLDQIRGMNKEFQQNSTYRDIIVNGTVNFEAARMLFANYPEIASVVRTRRSNDDYDESKDLNYDVEYGLLYY